MIRLEESHPHEAHLQGSLVSHGAYMVDDCLLYRVSLLWLRYQRFNDIKFPEKKGLRLQLERTNLDTHKRLDPERITCLRLEVRDHASA